MSLEGSLSPAIETTSILGESDLYWKRVHHFRASSAFSRLAFHDVTLNMGPCTHNISPPMSCFKVLYHFISCHMYPFCCISSDVDVAFDRLDQDVVPAKIMVVQDRMKGASC